MSQRELALHRRATETLLEAASRVDDARWNEPIAEGKWTPSEILDHLITSYEVLLRELSGGGGMQIRTSAWQQVLLRLLYVPRILRTGWFPKGARAPRETRPAGRGLTKAESTALFRTRAEEFETAVRAAPPSQQLTHAYFGTWSVTRGVALCARHIEHHAAQLPNAAR
jgi:hypothetical protein